MACPCRARKESALSSHQAPLISKHFSDMQLFSRFIFVLQEKINYIAGYVSFLWRFLYKLIYLNFFFFFQVILETAMLLAD